MEPLCTLPGRGLELGVLPNGNLHAVSGDTRRDRDGPLGSTWTAFDLTGRTIAERRFDGPVWLPFFWKGRQLTALTESRQDANGFWQHRSKLVVLEDGKPVALDEFDWECYADRPNVIGDHLWIGVSRGVGRTITSFAWRWDGAAEIRRFPIGRKMDWVSTPIAVQAGVIACEVESFLAKEEQAAGVCFLEDGTPITKTPWVDEGGEFAGKVYWVRDRLWVHTSRGVLASFAFEGQKLTRVPPPAFLGPAAGLSKDAGARLELYAMYGEEAPAAFGPEARLEWVMPTDRGALVGLWTFRKFVVRRIHPDGSTASEAVLPEGGVAMRRPVRHALAGLIGLLSDGTVITMRDERGSSTAVLPSLR